MIYSIGVNFAGGGIGSIAYHSAQGLYRAGQLKRVLCSSFRPTEIPRDSINAMGLLSRALRKLALFDASGWVNYLQLVLFDTWAAHRLESASLFQVWHTFGLHSLQKARAEGMITIVKRASSHPTYQDNLLTEEYARWGKKFPRLEAVRTRSMAELELADFVVIPSDFVRHTFLEQGFGKERLIQVPFGVDSMHFRPASRDADSSRPFRVLFVGQIGIRKGVPDLLQAWQLLNWHDAELWLVGRVEAGLQTLFARWERLRGVKRIDYAPDPVSLYQQADVFAFPTIEEGSALVTFEALACGVPLVTTNNAGSIVRDGAEGFIIPIRDVDALAGRLEFLRGNDQQRREMAHRARRRAELFTWDKHSRLYAEAMMAQIP